MVVDPIFFQPLAVPQEPATETEKAEHSFVQLLNQSLHKLNDQQGKADGAIKEYLAGDIQDLHRVTITLEEAQFGMQLAVQVRDKLLEAYQEVMRMQV